MVVVAALGQVLSWRMMSVASLLLGAVSAESVVDSGVTVFPLVPHHVHRARFRDRALVEADRQAVEEKRGHYYPRRLAAQQVGALYQGYGTHYVDLWCGSPPQRQTVIVDTGSGVTAFPCSGCTMCGQGHHIDGNFLEDQSPTFTKVKCTDCTRGRCSSTTGNDGCHIGMSYAEGSSWTAFEARDTCYIGGPHDTALTSSSKTAVDAIDPGHANDFAFDLMFGCQTKLTGLFKTQLADGIMGMDNAQESFWRQMYEAGKMGDDMRFALCYSRQPTADRKGTEAGAMTMGGYDSRLHLHPPVHVLHTSKGGGFFAVTLRKAYLREGGHGDSIGTYSQHRNTKTLQIDIGEGPLNTGNVIVDSGTTDTYFNRVINSAFHKTWKELFPERDYGHNPLSLTKEELEAMPTIILQMQGDVTLNTQLGSDPNSVVGLAGDLDPENPYDVLVALPPSHYMEYDHKVNKYVARFYMDESRGTVLGGNFMMGHDVIFDVSNSRIGWAESDCDYTALVRDNGFSIPAGQDSYDSPEKPAPPAPTPNPNGNNHSPPTNPDKVEGITGLSDVFAECTDLSCRVLVVSCTIIVLCVGFIIGRWMGSNRHLAPKRRRAELVPTAEFEMQPRYRDRPDGLNGAAGMENYKDTALAPPGVS